MGETAENRRRLLAVIRSDFERIHAEIKNLDVCAKVPLPNYPKETVSYDDLLVMESKNWYDFPVVVNHQIINVNVKNLLNGVNLESPHRIWETRLFGRMEKEASVSLFYSYSHRDETLRNELETHLKILERRNLISSWNDRQIEAGDDWKNEIDKNLESADIILLLISADFIASDYCYEKEMKCALERHNNGKAVVIPVILRDANWKKLRSANYKYYRRMLNQLRNGLTGILPGEMFQKESKKRRRKLSLRRHRYNIVSIGD